MSQEERRQLVIDLHAQGLSKRKISRTLGMSRNTIGKILRNDRKRKEPAYLQHLELIRQVFRECRGNAVRVQEILARHHKLNIGYSTLTRMLRDLEIRKPKPPVGTYTFQPGQEMQFDTSPHRVLVGDRQMTLQCAVLVLAHSRYLYARYFPCFTRFEAKWFLSEAFVFMDGTAQKCVVDNTNVVVLGGTGPEALIVPEMQDFGRLYGTTFLPHRLLHPQRKVRVERPFHYIENNFLAGRIFTDLDDLNCQLAQWCTEVANRKIKRSLAASPQEVWRSEKLHLTPLPPHLPPVYVCETRRADSRGYVSLDTNLYSVPQRYIHKRMMVHKFPREVKIYYDGQLIACHPRFLEKSRKSSTIPGHHCFGYKNKTRNLHLSIEKELRGHHPLLDQYLDELKKRHPGKGAARFKRLRQLWRLYPAEAFFPALERALHYGLFDLARLDALILRHIGGDFFQFPGDQS